MSFFYENAQVPHALSFADGIATTGDLYRAARDSAIYADNFVARDAAIEEAYDRRNDAIFKATGQRVANPMRQIEAEQRGHAEPVAARRWQQELVKLQAQYPQNAREIRAQVPIIEDAQLVAREAGLQFDAAVGSRDDFAGKWATILGGGFSGSMRDPVQVASMFLGAGTGAARTIFGKMLQTAAREAVLNGALEAAQQPSVQAWRKEAGLPAGFDEALRNTVTASAFAGLLGAGGRGAYELAGGAMKTLPPENLLRKAEEQDAHAAATVLAPIADTLDPTARGALQAAQADQSLAVSRPIGMDAETHDRNIAAGIRAAEDEGPITTIEVKDRRQGTLKRPMNVMEFIASIGGLRDDDGELAALGLSIRSSMTRHGPAVRKKGELVEEGGLLGAVTQKIKGKGLSADQVRERLVEAGYLDDAGDITGGNARSAATDVYELIYRSLAGEKVVARGDEGWQASVDDAAMKRRNDFELEKYGEDADRASRFGIAITEEAIAMRGQGVAWTDADLEFAADWHSRFPHESPQTAIEEAMLRRLYEQEKAAREIEPVQEDDFWVQHKPPKDWNDEPGTNLRLDDSGEPLPETGRTGDGSTGEGAAAGQRGPGGSAGPAQGESPGLNPAPSKPEGGIDDPTAPETATMADAMLATVKRDQEEMAREIYGEFPGRAAGWHSVADLMKDAERPQHLSALVEACKAV